MRTLLFSLMLAAVAIVIEPRPAEAVGFGYAYQLHQTEIGQSHTAGPDRVKIQFPVHRVTLLDTSGLFATMVASARYDREVEHGAYHTTTTETWSAEYTPMPQGVRVQLTYAWYDGLAELQRPGQAVVEEDVEYGELRFQVGALIPLERVYFDFDLIDIVSRDLSGAADIDNFAWQFNFEMGTWFGPLRAGARTELDLVSVVDAIFDDIDTAWTWGLAAYYDYKVGALSAVWRSYTITASDFGDVSEGRSLTFGASIEF